MATLKVISLLYTWMKGTRQILVVKIIKFNINGQTISLILLENKDNKGFFQKNGNLVNLATNCNKKWFHN